MQNILSSRGEKVWLKLGYAARRLTYYNIINSYIWHTEKRFIIVIFAEAMLVIPGSVKLSGFSI